VHHNRNTAIKAQGLLLAIVGKLVFTPPLLRPYRLRIFAAQCLYHSHVMNGSINQKVE